MFRGKRGGAQKYRSRSGKERVEGMKRNIPPPWLFSTIIFSRSGISAMDSAPMSYAIDMSPVTSTVVSGYAIAAPIAVERQPSMPDTPRLQ